DGRELCESERSRLRAEWRMDTGCYRRSARRTWRFSASCRLEPALVDGEAQPVAADQLVVGHAALQVLGDHVDVLEVALDEVALVRCRRAGGAVHGVDDLRRPPDAASG